jgi:hypothetical protein
MRCSTTGIPRVGRRSREPPTQLDSGRQLSLLIEGRADRSGTGLGDKEHPNSMGAHTVVGKHGVHCPLTIVPGALAVQFTAAGSPGVGFGFA